MLIKRGTDAIMTALKPGDVFIDGVLGFGPGGDKLFVVGTLATWDYSLGTVELSAEAGKTVRAKLVLGPRPEVGDHLRERRR